MWLTQKLANERLQDTQALIAEISIGGARPAARSISEQRDMDIVFAGPLRYKPRAGQRALVLNCTDGSRLIVGILDSDSSETLAEGEVSIKTDSATILLKNSGNIEIVGNVQVSGNLSLNGQRVLTREDLY